MVASTTPSSGIEIWKSDRTSSSIASNSWSVLSISSIRSTTGSGVEIAVRSGRAIRKSSEKMSSCTSCHAGARRLGLDPQQLLAVVPLVQRLGLVEALVALQAHEPALRPARQRLRELGLADPGRALDQHGLAELVGQERDERGGLVGQVARAGQAVAHLLERGGACRLRRLGHGWDDTCVGLAALYVASAALAQSTPAFETSPMAVHRAVRRRLRDRSARPPLRIEGAGRVRDRDRVLRHADPADRAQHLELAAGLPAQRRQRVDRRAARGAARSAGAGRSRHPSARRGPTVEPATTALPLFTPMRDRCAYRERTPRGCSITTRFP